MKCKLGVRGWELGVVKLGLVLIFCLFSTLHSSFALDIPRFIGEDIIVTALRTVVSEKISPWNTTIIRADELKNYNTVGEALKTVAGVDSQSYGSYGSLNSIRLRGANSTQVLILVDGSRINTPTLGMFDMGDLLTSNVERIEVVRAPLSAIYGSDAISGVINIITKSPAQGGRSFSASTNSFGGGKFSLSASNANFLLSANYFGSQGFRQNGDYLAKDAFLKVNFPIGIGDIIAQYDYYDADKGLPNVPTSEADPYSATTPNDRQKDKNTIASVGLKGENYFLRTFQNTFMQKLDPYIWGASVNQGNQTGIEWQQNFDLMMGKVSYGIDGRQDFGNTQFSGEHTIQTVGIYAQDMISFGEKGALIASMRADKHSVAGTAINPRLGLTYLPEENLIIKASVGTAFRAPTLNELYWNDGYSFGDPNLKPEKSFSYEIGLERSFSDNHWARVNYFRNVTTDLIMWDWKSNMMEARAKNVGEANVEGAEFELTQKIARDGKAFANITYQKAVDVRDFDPLAQGKILRYTPEIKYNVGIETKNSTILVRHVGERFADLYNTVKMAPYTVVDLKLFRKLSSAANVEFAVDNLFDENYSEVVGNDPVTFANRNFPMPRRTYTLGVKWEI
ncbi:MAG: TonB-dependent receptor [Candidatus Margulisiibacteriota bacterium]